MSNLEISDNLFTALAELIGREKKLSMVSFNGYRFTGNIALPFIKTEIYKFISKLKSCKNLKILHLVNFFKLLKKPETDEISKELFQIFSQTSIEFLNLRFLK